MKPRSSNLILSGTILIASLTAALALYPRSANCAAAPPSAAPTVAACPVRPLMFEPNRGQADPSFSFISHGQGYSLFLGPAEAIIALRQGHAITSLKTEVRNRILGLSSPGSPAAGSSAAIRLKFLNASPKAQLASLEPLPAQINYLIGNDPQQWHQNIPTFGRLKSSKLYPGVDLIYYGTEGQLEFDFVLGPGADPARIQLSVEGADELRIDDKGDLVIRAGAGEIRHHKPVIYQQEGSARREVRGGYVLKGRAIVGFEVGRYDRSKPLTIDPTLWFSTYLGGSPTLGISSQQFGGANDVANGIAVTTNGTTYVVGTTDGNCFLFGGDTNLLRLVGCRSTTNQPGNQVVFVAKYTATTFSNQTPVLMNMTFLGGSGSDQGEAIAVDNQGDVYITGTTTSRDFPIVNFPFQPVFAGGTNPPNVITFFPGDAFVAKLSIPDCCNVPAIGPSSFIVYSSYLGGSAPDFGYGIAVDALHNAYVTGATFSTNFPTTSGAFQRACKSCAHGFTDAFVAKIGPSGRNIVYSTLIGGSGEDDAFAIAVNPSTGIAYITGTTASTDFPHPGISPSILPFQFSLDGPSDAFVTVIGAQGTNLVWSTYLGGSSFDIGYGIAVSPPGFRTDVHVTGETQSPDFPTKNAFQPALGGFRNAFVTKVNSAGANLAYSTFFGGSGLDEAHAIALDTGNNAFITGFANSTNFPVKNAIQPLYAGGQDAFVAEFNLSGSNIFATYFGGSREDTGQGIAVDGAGRAYIAGWTTSTNFPVHNAVQSGYSGGASDAFVAKLGGLGHAASLTDIIAQVGDLDLNDGLINSLQAVLEQALQSFESGRPGVAAAQLGAFTAHVEALQAAGQLEPTIADALIASAQAIAPSP